MGEMAKETGGGGMYLGIVREANVEQQESKEADEYAVPRRLVGVAAPLGPD